VPEVSWLAVTVAAVVAFVLGGIWYSPALCGRIWMRETGLTEPELAKRSPALVFGVSFVLSLVAAAVFAMFLGPDVTPGFGASAGAAAGIAWVGTSFGINYLFERRSFSLWLVNTGYHALQFTSTGLVLGLWP
jgi:hypothetical protein